MSEAEIAYRFMMLPYVSQACLLEQYNFLTEKNREKQHVDILEELFNKLRSNGRLEEFGHHVESKFKKLYNKGPTLFASTESTPDRLDELREAAEPLRAYLKKYGDPHTCVIVTQYGATETRDERRVLFLKETLDEQEAQFERELKAIVTGNG